MPQFIAKNLLTVLILSICIGSSIAQTDVPEGTVSGTWTKGSSPYIVNGNLTIPESMTLRIEPGVQILFSGHFVINVNGSIVANGAPLDSIVIDRMDMNSSWHSIRIENTGSTSDSSIFEYCRIAHANYSGGDVTANGGNAVLVKNYDKVRISNCLIRNNHGGRGAGIYAEQASIKIINNVIRNNSVAQYGAGIYVQSGSPLIRGNRIESNYGSDGAGGIWLSGSKSRIEDNHICYNTSYWSGAGVTINNNSSCLLLRNVITYNESGHDDGGGLMISASSPSVMNNTIAYNKAEDGEGVYIVSNSNPIFTNCIIYNNRDRYDNTNDGDEIYIGSSTSNSRFYNCNIQGGIAGIVVYSGVFSGVAENNLDTIPKFKDPALNDFSIQWVSYPLVDFSKSPCIDAGKLDSPHDPDGSRADIGAIYFHQSEGKFPPAIDFEADTLLGINTLLVSFKDLSVKGNSSFVNWHWDFGDGNSSTAQHPIHQYSTEGKFNVTLTITDQNGFEKTLTKRKYIQLITGQYIKGKVFGTLDKPRYLVGGDLLVEEAKTLIVKPGVEFIFLGPYKLEVYGALKAKGTRDKKILFTALDPVGINLSTSPYAEKSAGWAGISVYASGPQDSTVIDYCKIQFVENNNRGAINAFAGNGAKGIRISNSEIAYNSTKGISVASSDVVIRNNYIHHNYAIYYQKGAGLYIYIGTPLILNNIISNNETGDDGGGICVDWDARPSIIGNAITHNKASRAGGICDYSGSIELINNTIAFNSSTNSMGGGYYILYAGDVTFTNNIITNNSPAQIEVADWYTRIGLRNCILEGGREGIHGFENSVFMYENMLSEDPKLVPGHNSHGLLLPASPAVDKGTTFDIESLLPAYDLIGNTRVKDGLVDIGAYEYVSDPPLTLVNPISDVFVEEDFDPVTVSLESVFEYKYGNAFLSFSVDNNSSLVHCDVRNNTLYITSLWDRFGDQIVEVTATNGINTVTSSFVVHITPVDDEPMFNIPGDLVVYEDFELQQVYEINFDIAFGEENQQRLFTLEPATVDFANVQFNPAGSLAFSAKPNRYGSQQFTLTYTENQKTYSESFIFTVQGVNDAPIIMVDVSPILLSENEELVLPIVLSDIENDILTLSAWPLNNFISINTTETSVNNYTMTITPNSLAPSGVYLTVSDGFKSTTTFIPITVVTGIDEEPILYSIYPNPAVDYVMIKARTNSSVVILNSEGRPIMQDKVGTSELKLHVNHLSAGVYLLQITDGQKSNVFRVLKK